MEFREERKLKIKVQYYSFSRGAKVQKSCGKTENFMLINVYFLKLPQQSTHSWGWTAICVCRGRYVFSQPQLFIKQILTYMDYNNLSVPVYRNCKQKAIYNEMRMEEIFHKVKNDIELRVCTEAYRNALMLKLPESQLKKMKTETFPMLLPAVYCEDGRSAKDIVRWTNVCQADFDHMKPECIDEAKRRLRELPFVAMYHTSMSGKGLHVYYAYLTPNNGLNAKTYEQAFRQGNELIAAAVNCDYDRAAEDPVHGSSICHDPDAWLNPDVTPMKVDMTLNMGKRAKDDAIGNKEAVTEEDWPEGWTAERVYELAKKMVEASAAGTFTQGNRNHYLVALAALLSDFGMKLTTAQQLMEKEYAGAYGEEPIPSLVSGCYRTVAKMHGMKALPSNKKKGGGKKGDVKMQVSAEFIKRQYLRFDSISRKIVKPDGSEITDRDINSMLLACNVETGQNISVQVFRAALMSNCIPEFNPLVDYLTPPERKGQEAAEPEMGVIERVADMVHVSFSPMECGERNGEWRSEESGERREKCSEPLNSPAQCGILTPHSSLSSKHPLLLSPLPLALLLQEVVCGDGGVVAQAGGGEPSDARAHRETGDIQEHVARRTHSAGTRPIPLPTVGHQLQRQGRTAQVRGIWTGELRRV